MRLLLLPSLSSQIGLSLPGLVHVTLRVGFPLPLTRQPKEPWPREVGGGEARFLQENAKDFKNFDFASRY